MKEIKKEEMEKSKQRILDVATELFAKQGFDGTSIRQICKYANANICMISYYWGGKQELYNGIVDDIIERQTQYIKTFLDLETDFSKIKKQEQIEHLFFVLDKFIEFFYSKQISNNLILFLLKAQQNSSSFIKKSLAYNYLKRLIAAVFNLKIDSRENILKTVFIISQINSPRILPAFSLQLLKQENFMQEDIEIIKNNLKTYICALLNEVEK